MSEETKKIIEINGVKLEVDLRTAKRIDEFKVGDNIKLLSKSNGSYNVEIGVIIDFVNFKELPTIQIMTYKEDYWGSDIKIVNFNSETKDYEIQASTEHDITLSKNRVIDKMNLSIEKKRGELDDLLRKKEYFIKNFKKYFKNEGEVK